MLRYWMRFTIFGGTILLLGGLIFGTIYAQTGSRAFLPVAMFESTPDSNPAINRPATATFTPTPAIASSATATATTTPTEAPTETPTPQLITLQRDNNLTGDYWIGASGGTQIGIIFELDEPVLLQDIYASFRFDLATRFFGRGLLYSVDSISPTLQVSLLNSGDAVVVPPIGTNFVTDRYDVVSMFASPSTVTGKIMLALEYSAGNTGTTPYLHLDTQTNIPQDIVWISNDGGATWTEHYAYWGDPKNTGYPLLRGSGIPGTFTPTPTSTNGSATLSGTPTPNRAH